MLPNIGFGELVIILALALLLFGTKRLPEVAKGVGKSFKAFKRGLKEVSDDFNEAQADIETLPEKKRSSPSK